MGIPHSKTARTKWCLTCNDKAQIGDDTRMMLDVDSGEQDTADDEDDPHKDILESYIKKSQLFLNRAPCFD